MEEFKNDSLNGLMFRLLSEVDKISKNKEQQKEIMKITREIFNRIEKHDEELSEIVNDIENVRGML